MPDQAPIWILMPVLGARDYTITAIADCLQQTVPIRLLIINQGVADPFRDELERIAETYPDRVFLWSHQPPLPALAASWNRALDAVWEAGGDRALVINNDVRLHPQTVAILSQQLDQQEARFISAVGVTAEQFDPATEFEGFDWGQHGGPDFSCFLISRACHDAYRFDEDFVPAYGEDCCYHRELMLGGDGTRIFSINLPFLHYASGTLKTADTTQRRQLEQQIELSSRAYYRRAWGGPVNAERYLRKHDPTSARDGVTNPELQALVQAGQDVVAYLGGVADVSSSHV